MGTFNNYIPYNYIPALKYYLDNNMATSSPHAFGPIEFIYYNHNGLSDFDPVTNCQNAHLFYTQNQLKLSNFFVPHYYEFSSECLPALADMGFEFISTQILPDRLASGSDWINCGPYRINRFGNYSIPRPTHYSGYITLNGTTFFNCLTEIQDDGGYEWYPHSGDISEATARGIRQLRRSLNSMVFTTLFTHEQYIDYISVDRLNNMLQEITSAISGYNPIYTTMDYAVQYVRAKTNVTLTQCISSPGQVRITYTANNDLDTQCYLFNEVNGTVTYTMITIPQYSGSNQIIISK